MKTEGAEDQKKNIGMRLKIFKLAHSLAKEDGRDLSCVAAEVQEQYFDLARRYYKDAN